MKESEQRKELDKIGRKLIDKAIHSMLCQEYCLEEQMDLVLKAGEMLQLLNHLEVLPIKDRD